MNKITILSKNEITQFCSPLVYIFWKDTVPLYVGMAAKGISRPLSANHHRSDARKESTHIELRFVNSDIEAFDLETQLIQELKPLHNFAGLDKIPQRSTKVKQFFEPKLIKQKINMTVHCDIVNQFPNIPVDEIKRRWLKILSS
jgi:hypothetical protein